MSGCGFWSVLEVQLQFIGTLAAGRWSELGGCYSEVRNVLVQWKNQWGGGGAIDLVSVWRLVAPRRGR